MLHCKAGQMAASDYVHYLQKSLASFGASTDGKATGSYGIIGPSKLTSPYCDSADSYLAIRSAK